MGKVNNPPTGCSYASSDSIQASQESIARESAKAICLVRPPRNELNKWTPCPKQETSELETLYLLTIRLSGQCGIPLGCPWSQRVWNSIAVRHGHFCRSPRKTKPQGSPLMLGISSSKSHRRVSRGILHRIVLHFISKTTTKVRFMYVSEASNCLLPSMVACIHQGLKNAVTSLEI